MVKKNLAIFIYLMSLVVSDTKKKNKGIHIMGLFSNGGVHSHISHLKAICDLAEDHDFWIIDDITYRDFAPNHVLAADILPEKTITGYSVSKNCGLAGLRVGSLVGPKEFISEVLCLISFL